MNYVEGMLKLSKLADPAGLSQAIFSVPFGELPQTESVLTMVSARMVYDAAVLHGNSSESIVNVKQN
jgi:predicted amidohydrolase YtcJ